MATPALVLIDLDGTLVDSLPDIAFCVDGMLTELGLPTAGQARVGQWVGNGTDILVRRALAGNLDGEVDEEQFARASLLFTALYKKHTSERSRVYEGVESGLDYLGAIGAVLACVTNKASAFTHKLLSDMDLDKHFSLVISGDTLARKKPDPLPLLHAARHFAIPPEQALLIGDSANDVEAARAAGFRVVCVSYGYNHGNDIRDSRPDAVIDSLAELPALFQFSPRANSAG